MVPYHVHRQGSNFWTHPPIFGSQSPVHLGQGSILGMRLHQGRQQTSMDGARTLGPGRFHAEMICAFYFGGLDQADQKSRINLNGVTELILATKRAKY